MFRLFLMCCLRSSFTHMDVSQSVIVVLSLVFARCDRMSIRICSSVSAAPSLCIHPCRTGQGSLDDRSDSFSTFIVVWFRRSSVRCQRCTTQTTSSVTVSLGVCRRHVESSWLNLWSSFNCNPWQWRFSSSSVRCSFSLSAFISRATICRGVPVQFLPRTTPFLVIHKTGPFDHDDQQRFLESYGLQMN